MMTLRQVKNKNRASALYYHNFDFFTFWKLSHKLLPTNENIKVWKKFHTTENWSPLPAQKKKKNRVHPLVVLLLKQKVLITCFVEFHGTYC